MQKLLTICLVLILANQVSAQDKPEFEVACIGFYNLENLFDTLDSPTTNDADFLPLGKLLWDTEKYVSKMQNMERVVSELGTELNPDGVAILGVAEIENAKVLEDLVAQPKLKSRNYQIVHYDSPDERGVDVGLLYQPKYFTVLGSRAVALPLVNPKNGEVDYTRDVLFVSGTLSGGETLHVLVNHWPSRRGGEKASAWARQAAAALNRQIVDSLQVAAPDCKVVVMGDLNDDPGNKSVSEILRGRANPKRMEATDMYNPMFDFYKNGHGTMAYRDAWSLFDQILVTKGFVSQKVGGWQFYKAVVFRRDYLTQTEGTFKGYPFRTFSGDLFINGYSDHLPVYFFALREKQKR